MNARLWVLLALLSLCVAAETLVDVLRLPTDPTISDSVKILIGVAAGVLAGYQLGGNGGTKV